MPKVHIITREPLLHIARNMRPLDFEEFACCREDTASENIVDSLLMRGGYGYIVYADDGEPVSAIGAVRLWSGVYALWAFGTDRWPEVVLTLTKVALRVIMPELLKQGFHRGECRALASRNDVARWLGLLGLKHEGRLSGFGSGREDFNLYAWTADEQSQNN